MRRRGTGRLAAIPLEDEEQISLFRWADIAERHTPSLKMLFSIANEGGRLKNLRFAGVKKGVPDIFFAHPSGGQMGMFIELKRRKGGKVAFEQYQWIAALQAEGYHAVVAYGWDEAREAILAYLGRAGG